jgi:hypothetical protein
VRLSVPGQPGASIEGVVHFVEPSELDDDVAQLVVDQWSMQGAPTLEGLRRTLRDRVHALVRVEAAKSSFCADCTKTADRLS